MKMPRNAEARQILIRKLRKGVHSQIDLWDMASSIAETLGVELELVLEFCQGIAVHADTGMELGEEDLQDLLDLLTGKPSSKIWRGKPLVTIN
jgi:hypothetical protein